MPGEVELLEQAQQRARLAVACERREVHRSADDALRDGDDGDGGEEGRPTEEGGRREALSSDGPSVADEGAQSEHRYEGVDEREEGRRDVGRSREVGADRVVRDVLLACRIGISVCGLARSTQRCSDVPLCAQLRRRRTEVAAAASERRSIESRSDLGRSRASAGFSRQGQRAGTHLGKDKTRAVAETKYQISCSSSMKLVAKSEPRKAKRTPTTACRARPVSTDQIHPRRPREMSEAKERATRPKKSGLRWYELDEARRRD